MNPPLTPRSRSESLFMTIPLVFAGFLISAVAVLAFLVWRGGEVSGPRVKMIFSISCEQPDVTQIQNTLKKRVADVGLGDPKIELISSTDGKPQVSLVTTLPGLDGDKEKIPQLFSRVGELTIKDAGGNILATKKNLQETSLALDESGMPYVGLFLDMDALKKMSTYVSQNPELYMNIYVDEEISAQRPNSVKVLVEDEFEIRIVSEDGDVRERMQLAADRNIVLSHPSYPCPLELDSMIEITSREP